MRNLIYFEMGLIGLAAFLAIFVVLFAQLYRGCTHDRAGAIVLAILCIGYLTVSYADNLLDYLNFEWFFWFVLGTVMAWIRLWTGAPIGVDARVGATTASAHRRER